MHMIVDVIADATEADPGFVGQRLVEEHGADLRLRDRDHLTPGVTTNAELLVLLGSARNIPSTRQPSIVNAESALVLLALNAGGPVMGICCGAQLMAHAPGVSVNPTSDPEVGWHRRISKDPVGAEPQQVPTDRDRARAPGLDPGRGCR